MDRQSLIPNLSQRELLSLFEKSQWYVDHGSLERFPNFLRPDLNGPLSSIRNIAGWKHFDVGYRDHTGKYNQVTGGGIPAGAYYEMGALVRSSAIEEITPETKKWLNDWATVLNVVPQDLRLNSWAVKGASGIDWHFDPEDVIHFQIKGDKLFKFLRTPNNRFADLQTKRHEGIFKNGETFDNAEQVLVKAGTITIIPRGVWHWSEGKSEESFAVALCVNPPSYATVLTQALYQRLRQYDLHRMALYGDEVSQAESLKKVAAEASEILKNLNVETILAQNGRQDFSNSLKGDSLLSNYFFINPNRAKVQFAPQLKLFLDGSELATQGEPLTQNVLQTLCKLGTGFQVSDLKRNVPDASIAMIAEIIEALLQVGFLELVDGVSAENLQLG